jgi:ribosomal protein L16 Arg81 hydroxylase
MTSNAPTDVALAREYVDLYNKQAIELEEKLRELAIDKQAFNLLFGQFCTTHRLAVAAEESWKDALKEEFTARRAEAAKKRPFWR